MATMPMPMPEQPRRQESSSSFDIQPPKFDIEPPKIQGGHGGRTTFGQIRPNVVVIADRALRGPLRASGTAAGTYETDELARRLDHYDAEVEPQAPDLPVDALLDAEIERVTGLHPDDLFVVNAEPQALERLADDLRGTPGIRGAYVKAAVAPAHAPQDQIAVAHVGPAPEGVNAAAAWSLPGGRGDGVTVYDVEGAWDTDHEALRDCSARADASPGIDDVWVKHGTSVFGVLGGSGRISGICPAADLEGVTIAKRDPAQAIWDAYKRSKVGDVVLIEVHRTGLFSHQAVLPAIVAAPDAAKEPFLPLEWWPDEWIAIRKLTGSGRVVVEAAGNGGMYLLDPLLGSEPQDFKLVDADTDWQNPFGRGARDSFAILVGAGVPPAPYATTPHPDRARYGSSNYGAAVDVQGWGEGVVTATTGSPYDPDSLYTQSFGETSAAAAIVAGVVACLQGVLCAEGLAPLDAYDARRFLRKYGSEQVEASDRPLAYRVGPRPDLQKLLDAAIDWQSTHRLR